MSVQFEWQTRKDDGEWETVSTRRRRRRVPRWAWLAVLATVLVLVTAVTLIIRRYHQALDRITFQIQSVIDLEAQAFADGDAERFLAQQDDEDSEWYESRQQLAESGLGEPDVARQGVLPAKVQRVQLREDIAWVEVIEDNDPVRRMRFYRQTQRGWLHTAPDPAFWGVPVEAHFERRFVRGSQQTQALPGERLVVRYHRQDQSHLDPVVDQLGAAFYEVCATVGCPRDEVFQAVFVARSPPGYVPRYFILLPSPWIDGIPVEGTYAERATETSVYALAHRVASVSMSHYVFPSRALRAAIVDEYATWISAGDLARTPLLRRVVARHGTDALPELFAWLAQAHSGADLLARWLNLTPHGHEIAYFQALLEIERDALYAGRRDTFLLLQDSYNLQWFSDQSARFERFHEQDASVPPDIRVEMVEISGDRARVTFETATDAQSPWQIQSPAFFRLERDTWLHTPPPHAPYTERLSGPSSVASTGDVVTVTFSCWDTEFYQGMVNVFHAYYGSAGTRVTVEPGIRRYGGYPGIHIQLVDEREVMDLPNFAAETRLRAEWQLADAVDAGDWLMSPESIAEDLLRDLGPFIDADTSVDRADFYSHTIEAYQYGEGVWALPWYATTSPIYYDRDAFDAAGVPYPEPGWTYEDFLHAARLLTPRDGDEVERYGFVDLAGSWHEIILALVDPPSGDTGLVIPDLTAPDIVRAVEWYTGLALEHDVMPNPRHPAPALDVEGPSETLRALVTLGRAAMWSDYLGNWGEHSREANLGVAPFPTGKRHLQYWSSGGYFISRDTAHPEAAWTWIRFLTYQQSFGRYSPWYRYQVPARRSVAEATGYWSQWDAASADALQYGLEHGTVYRWDESLAALSQAIDAVFDGAPVEEALAEAKASLGE
jgi:multiple sugar transport system substrate-binding protein